EEVNGLCGLIANFQLNQFHKAYLVCAPDTKCSDNLVGSVRLPDGYDITKFLADNSKYFLAAGGHSQAAGLTFASKDYYQVATLFLTECEKQGLNIIDEQSGSIGMSLEDLNSENFAVYESFKPFGQQFPSPVFEITVDKDQLSFSQKGNAVFAFSESKKSKIVYFGLSEPFTQERYSSFSFYGQFSCETYNSKTSYVLKSNKYIANID
ncbi:MAG: hypothetical protein WCR67_02430, partial [Bacilli bacterium]